MSTDLVFGDQFRFYLNYFVDNGDLISYGLKSQWVRFHGDTRVENNLGYINVDVTFNDFTSSIFLQSNFDKKFAITTGIKYKIYKESSETFETDNNDFEFVDNKYLIPYANITLDALDDSMFPTKGLYFDFGAQWYAFADHTNQLLFHFQFSSN